MSETVRTSLKKCIQLLEEGIYPRLEAWESGKVDPEWVTLQPLVQETINVGRAALRSSQDSNNGGSDE